MHSYHNQNIIQHLPDQGLVRRAEELVITVTLLIVIQINPDRAVYSNQSSPASPGLMDAQILVRIMPMATMEAGVIIMMRGRPVVGLDQLQLEGVLVHHIHHEIMANCLGGDLIRSDKVFTTGILDTSTSSSFSRALRMHSWLFFFCCFADTHKLKTQLVYLNNV